MSRWIIAVSVLALFAGCAGGGATWEKPGASAEQRAKDEDDCMNKATLAGDPGSIDANVRAAIQRDFENCMMRRGYRLTAPEK
jgi:hypothetical protein